MNERMKSPKKRKLSRRHDEELALTFSPTAWAKLIYLRDRGGTEVGGFAITAGDNPLHVTDVQLVRQHCTLVTVAFDDESVADFIDRQVDSGLTLTQCMRIWVHTHPGDSAQPSSTDEETFARVFGSCEWAVMCIVAEGGETYARLRFNVGPGGETELPVMVDFAEEFDGSDWDAWEAEYLANVVPLSNSRPFATQSDPTATGIDLDEIQLERMWREDWTDYVSQHELEEYQRYDL